MTSLAVPLPRLRRFRRPPARLVFTALHLTLDLLWLAGLLTSIVGDHVWIDGLWTFFAVRFTIRDHAQLRKVVAAWLASEPVRPVSRREWWWLTVFGLTIALALVLTALNV